MDEDLSQLKIDLQVDEDISPVEMEELTAAIRRELLQLDVESVDRVSAGPAPAGAKGIELAQIGALIVSLGGAAPVLGQVVAAIQAWTARSSTRTVKLTLNGDSLELGGVSEDEQRQVAKDWMARHERAPSRRKPATPPAT
jgi:hypothetical protein